MPGKTGHHNRAANIGEFFGLIEERYRNINHFFSWVSLLSLFTMFPYAVDFVSNFFPILIRYRTTRDSKPGFQNLSNNAFSFDDI